MEPEDQLQIDEIVLKAAALDPPERDAYLRGLTATRPEILAEASRLLAAASKLTESFLAVPAGGMLDALAEPSQRLGAGTGSKPERAPTSEERYELGERLGGGGMADVYKAHDRLLDRPVAFKWMHLNDVDQTARCLREARAQAQTRHEHVLDVYETGEYQGRPFIAMRYVEGTTLAEIPPDTSLEARVRLLAQVADGLDAAHRTGLVHRDVKPSNILVEESSEGRLNARVTDFGIAAAALQPASQGTDRWLRGTAHYVAPERLVGPEQPADRRSDIFSFGVTLFELLTGELPFDHEVVVELLRQIRDEEPRRPREVAPTLPVDLEAIILKCLAKDPALRYQSAAAVAADLRRFLAGDVVEAHAAGVAYRWTKFALRHKKLIALASTALGLLVVALALAAVLGVSAMRANDKAELRRDQAESLLSFLILDLREKLEAINRLEILEEIGDKAMEYFSSVPESELSDEELARRSTALYQIGSVRMRQGRLDSALRPFRESLALARELAARDSNNSERLFDLGQSHFWVGYAYVEQGDEAGALEHLSAYYDLSERLVAWQPGERRWQLELAYASSNLGRLRRDQGDFVDARELYRTSLDIRRQLADENPTDLDLQSDLAIANNLLGVVLEELGEVQEARRHFDEDLRLKKVLVAADSRQSQWRDDLGVSHNYLGGWMLRYGEWPAAVGHFQEAVDVYAELREGDPTNSNWIYKSAINRLALGRSLCAVGDAKTGMEQFVRFQDLLSELIERNPESAKFRRELAVGHTFMAEVRLEQGQDPEARHHANSAVELFEPLVAADPNDRRSYRGLSQSYLLLGSIEAASQAVDDAQVFWRRAAGLLEPLVRQGDNPRDLAPWALASQHLGHHVEAAPAIARLHALGFCDPSFRELCPAGKKFSFER